MIPEYRERFNQEFTEEKYKQVIQLLTEAAGAAPKFRVSESPVFLTVNFRDKLLDACDSIITQIKNMSNEELAKAIPPQYHVPNDTLQPHFFTIDFGICQNEKGEPEPQLIELQSFPSLYGFQRTLKNTLSEVYPFLEELKPYTSTESYFQQFRELIVGDEHPEHTILLEIHPHQQKTNVDFYLTEKITGIKTVCLSEVKKKGRQLFYEHDGRLIQIKRIYNRVIFDELDHIEGFSSEFDFREEADVTWVTHPNWYFKVSKFLLPKLHHAYVPKSYFLHEFPAAENPENFVLKPLFSFAGAGVNLNPTEQIIEAIPDKENFIMQRKVSYAPLFKDINGDFSKAEIRLLYIWPEHQDRPTLIENLVRMTKSAMVNIDFNKDQAIWIGGSTAFFER